MGGGAEALRPLKLVSILAAAAFLALAAQPAPARASHPNSCQASLTLHDLGPTYQVQATLTCTATAFDIDLVSGTISAGPELNDQVGVDCAYQRVCEYWSPTFDKSWGISQINASTLWAWRNHQTSPIHRVGTSHLWAFSAPPSSG